MLVISGQTVKAGDTIVVIEAMKMENPIAAPKSGIITMAVKKGANVETGDLLCTIA